MTDPLLSVEGLTIDYVVGTGTYHAVRDVSFTLERGRVVGIVGETGCGKSTLAHAIPCLLPEPPARVRAGKVVFDGKDLLAMPRWQIPYVRGTGIGMIFQEPINSLDPAFRISRQVAEAIAVRRRRESGRSPGYLPGPRAFDYSQPRKTSAAELASGRLVGSLPGQVERVGAPPSKASGAPSLREEVLDYLRLVRINDPETILDRYPHELSGGMRQRVMIATALSAKPSLLIADEPTSALDVTIQAQVLTLMKELMEEVRTSILFISHDLGVIAEMADEVGVMYAGQLVEFGPVAEIFARPRHPYTKALLRSIPTGYHDDGPLTSLPGSVPNLSRLTPGCAFAPRCPRRQDDCIVPPGPALAPDPLLPSTDPRTFACFHPEPVDA